MSQHIHRISNIKSESGLSRSTLYIHIATGLWTKPIRLSARAVGWPSSETTAIIEARIAGKSDQEIRDLVAELEAARKFSPRRGK